jgi:hypothetical protein
VVLREVAVSEEEEEEEEEARLGNEGRNRVRAGSGAGCATGSMLTLVGAEKSKGGRLGGEPTPGIPPGTAVEGGSRCVSGLGLGFGLGFGLDSGRGSTLHWVSIPRKLGRFVRNCCMSG